MSHFLTPLLSTAVKFEPWLWVLQRCFQAFVRLHSAKGDSLMEIWNLIVNRAPNKQPIGPISILISHLRKMGWTVKEDFRCVTQRDDTFKLSEITSWQLKWQIMSSWPDCIAPKLRQKVGMNDLESFSVTASKWSNNDPKLAGFVSTLQTGGLFTNKVKAKISTGKASTCALCGGQDGIIHSLFECPSTANLREGDDWDVIKKLASCNDNNGLISGTPNFG